MERRKGVDYNERLGGSEPTSTGQRNSRWAGIIKRLWSTMLRGGNLRTGFASGTLIPARACIALVLVALAGCRTVPAGEQIPQFHQGVVTADHQTAQAFAEVNSFLRERQIDRAVVQPSLSESEFFTPLAPEDVAKWHRAFELLAMYAQSLEKLLDPKIREGVEQELAGLGEAIGRGRGEELPSGVAAAFTTLGGLLVQIRSERDAMAAIQKADAGVQEVLAAMGDAIGANETDAIRGTVHTSWQQVLAAKSAEFLRTKNEAQKRALVSGYAAALDQRDARDLSLASLRRSIGLLAEAHAELSAGRNEGAQNLIEMVQVEYSRWAKRRTAIDEARAGAAEGSKGPSP